MTKFMAHAVLLGSAILAGCGDADADADAAGGLVGEARAIYEGRTKGTPGKLPGTFILAKADVALCIEQMESAQGKLQQLQANYPTTEVAAAGETRSLEGAVASQLGTCRNIKKQQGW